ncbi:hypothetical protein C3R44_23770, partial [Mycobacterium tuberculosis]
MRLLRLSAAGPLLLAAFVPPPSPPLLGLAAAVGSGLLRVPRAPRWPRSPLFPVVWPPLLALGFAWGVALPPLEIGPLF